MINLKKIKPIDLLRLFLGIVFLSAGIYRAFHWQQALLEFSILNLSSYLIYLTVLLEIIGGLALIFNVKTKKVLFVFIAFLLIALINVFLTSGKNIISQSGELFFFNPNPTDVFLHFTYLVIILYLVTQKKD